MILLSYGFVMSILPMYSIIRYLREITRRVYMLLGINYPIYIKLSFTRRIDTLELTYILYIKLVYITYCFI